MLHLLIFFVSNDAVFIHACVCFVICWHFTFSRRMLDRLITERSGKNLYSSPILAQMGGNIGELLQFVFQCLSFCSLWQDGHLEVWCARWVAWFKESQFPHRFSLWLPLLLTGNANICCCCVKYWITSCISWLNILMRHSHPTFSKKLLLTTY